MSMGGPQCTTDSGTQVAADPMFADAVDAGFQAGASAAAGQAASVAGPAAGGGGGGGVGPAKMKKKPATPAPDPAAAAPASTGMIRLFRVTSETTSIHSGPVAATTFDVPAGDQKAD